MTWTTEKPIVNYDYYISSRNICLYHHCYFGRHDSCDVS